MRRIALLCLLALLTSAAAGCGSIVTDTVGSTQATNARLDVGAIARAPAKRSRTHRESFLFGQRAIEPAVSSAGSAEAFRFASQAAGTASAIHVYVDRRSQATRLVVGLYSDRAGRPGKRLTTGALRSPKRGAWNRVRISHADVKRGSTYWIAVLGNGGTLYVRDIHGGRCHAAGFYKTARRSLASAWRGRPHRNDCLISAYVTGTRSTVRQGQPGGTTGPTPVPTQSPVQTGSGGGGGPGIFSVLFWTAWESNVSLSQIPWNSVSAVNLFAVTPCATSGTTDCPSYSSINTNVNCLRCISVSQWVSTVHSHGKLAFITVGGSSFDGDWGYPCSSANVSAFASNLVTYMKTNGFDGIDVDIEQDATTGNPVFTPADDVACMTDIYNAAKAVKTAAGQTPLVTEDLDPTIDYDLGANARGHVDWFNMMSYNADCSNDCASVKTDLNALVTKSGIPASLITIGTDTESGDRPTTSSTYQELATTSSAVSTSGPITSIPVSALSAAIPAGNIVLASSQNPPSNYQIFQTPGAAQGATSIAVSPQTPNHAYPSGSVIQSDYRGPWNCAGLANYASQPTNGVRGVMVWTAQGDAAAHNGNFACLNQIAPYVNP